MRQMRTNIPFVHFGRNSMVAARVQRLRNLSRQRAVSCCRIHWLCCCSRSQLQGWCGIIGVMLNLRHLYLLLLLLLLLIFSLPLSMPHPQLDNGHRNQPWQPRPSLLSIECLLYLCLRLRTQDSAEWTGKFREPLWSQPTVPLPSNGASVSSFCLMAYHEINGMSFKNEHFGGHHARTMHRKTLLQ
jgi:hypothetical protein